MSFYVAIGFLDTSELVEIAKAADDVGYDGWGYPITSSMWSRSPHG